MQLRYVQAQAGRVVVDRAQRADGLRGGAGEVRAGDRARVGGELRRRSCGVEAAAVTARAGAAAGFVEYVKYARAAGIDGGGELRQSATESQDQARCTPPSGSS
ncbi:hypothetical protein [Streptomyces boninensis]|uniref:hypothetical protein n=1 Tax=Streptomyces boninensis TaxID=2039455 RepID=UPI003B2186D0